MKYLFIVLLSIGWYGSAFAHDRDSVPIIPQSTTTQSGGNNNQNNHDDNVKHFGEILVVTGIIYCVVKHCWKQESEEIHFKGEKNEQ